ADAARPPEIGNLAANGATAGLMQQPAQVLLEGIDAVARDVGPAGVFGCGVTGVRSGGWDRLCRPRGFAVRVGAPLPAVVACSAALVLGNPAAIGCIERVIEPVGIRPRRIGRAQVLEVAGVLVPLRGAVEEAPDKRINFGAPAIAVAVAVAHGSFPCSAM